MDITESPRQKMTSVLKALWLSALRGNTYLQGRMRLRSYRVIAGAVERITLGSNYCCLGVLADVVDPSGWKDDARWHGQNFFPCLLPYSQEETLSKLNDAGASFKEIADWIEEHVEVED